ncbi:MAG: glycosyltransferase family 2 protein [Acidimicrobiia bacterium]
MLDAEPRSKTNAWFRLGVVALLVGTYLAIRLIKAWMWPDGGHEPDGMWDQVLRWGAIGWAILLPWALADVSGWLLYRPNTKVSAETRAGGSTEAMSTGAMSTEVAFRVVTRGDQPRVLRATVANIIATMGVRPLFPHRIEVVTDTPMSGLDSLEKVTQIVVPPEYGTSNSATHKARALNFAMETSSLPDESWILHLDEESHITEELVVGIRNAVSEEEGTGEHRIGQGLILYHRDIASNTFLTLADSIRVGDDLGRFHLQYRLNRVLFGMHGSFVLVRNSVEKEVGFDFTPPGCVTEDTTWGLSQMDRERRSAGSTGR